jgi:hypothetical protein
MPQPKQKARASSSTRQRKPAEREPDENLATRLAALREAMTRAVILPTDGLRDALDDAVRRGRITRNDAEELYQSLLAAGRRQIETVISDLEQMLGRSRGATRERIVREVDRARRATGLTGASSFPIEDYDELAAAQITSKLDKLSAAELRQVRDYERRHANRKTVLAAVERKLS